MIERLRQSMEALQVLQKAQEVTANNLANINTPGFKSDKVFFRAFQDAVNGNQVSSVEPYQTMDMSQGSLTKTENPFDFAIQGQGFFEVRKGGQALLKRSGNFKLDANGFLVDEQGAHVMGRSGAVQLPVLTNSSAMRADTDIDVAKDGSISVNGENYGQLKLVNVPDSQQLERRGQSYYHAPQDMIRQGNEMGSQIMQGYQESSNVNSLTEMVDMTKNMRLFQSQQRAMQSSNEILSKVTNGLGKF